jgi:hypothetical protein
VDTLDASRSRGPNNNTYEYIIATAGMPETLESLVAECGRDLARGRLPGTPTAIRTTAAAGLTVVQERTGTSEHADNRKGVEKSRPI